MILALLILANVQLLTVLVFVYNCHTQNCRVRIQQEIRAKSRVCFKCKELKSEHSTNEKGETYCTDCK